MLTRLSKVFVLMFLLVVSGCASKAVCPDMHKTTAASGVDDGASPRLTDTAQRDYFVLRERIETITNQLNGLQEYVRSQCSY